MGEDHTCRQAYRNLQVAIKKRKKRYTLTQKKTHDAIREKKNHKAALYTKQDPVFLKILHVCMCICFSTAEHKAYEDIPKLPPGSGTREEKEKQDIYTVYNPVLSDFLISTGLYYFQNIKKGCEKNL